MDTHADLPTESTVSCQSLDSAETQLDRAIDDEALSDDEPPSLEAELSAILALHMTPQAPLPGQRTWQSWPVWWSRSNFQTLYAVTERPVWLQTGAGPSAAGVEDDSRDGPAPKRQRGWGLDKQMAIQRQSGSEQDTVLPETASPLPAWGDPPYEIEDSYFECVLEGMQKAAPGALLPQPLVTRQISWRGWPLFWDTDNFRTICPTDKPVIWAWGGGWGGVGGPEASEEPRTAEGIGAVARTASPVTGAATAAAAALAALPRPTSHVTAGAPAASPFAPASASSGTKTQVAKPNATPGLVANLATHSSTTAARGHAAGSGSLQASAPFHAAGPAALGHSNAEDGGGEAGRQASATAAAAHVSSGWRSQDFPSPLFGTARPKVTARDIQDKLLSPSSPGHRDGMGQVLDWTKAINFRVHFPVPGPPPVSEEDLASLQAKCQRTYHDTILALARAGCSGPSWRRILTANTESHTLALQHMHKPFALPADFSLRVQEGPDTERGRWLQQILSSGTIGSTDIALEQDTDLFQKGTRVGPAVVLVHPAKATSRHYMGVSNSLEVARWMRAHFGDRLITSCCIRQAAFLLAESAINSTFGGKYRVVDVTHDPNIREVCKTSETLAKEGDTLPANPTVLASVAYGSPDSVLNFAIILTPPLLSKDRRVLRCGNSPGLPIEITLNDSSVYRGRGDQGGGGGGWLVASIPRHQGAAIEMVPWVPLTSAEGEIDPAEHLLVLLPSESHRYSESAIATSVREGLRSLLSEPISFVSFACTSEARCIVIGHQIQSLAEALSTDTPSRDRLLDHGRVGTLRSASSGGRASPTVSQQQNIMAPGLEKCNEVAARLCALAEGFLDRVPQDGEPPVCSVATAPWSSLGQLLERQSLLEQHDSSLLERLNRQQQTQGRGRGGRGRGLTPGGGATGRRYERSPPPDAERGAPKRGRDDQPKEREAGPSAPPRQTHTSGNLAQLVSSLAEKVDVLAQGQLALQAQLTSSAMTVAPNPQGQMDAAWRSNLESSINRLEAVQGAQMSWMQQNIQHVQLRPGATVDQWGHGAPSGLSPYMHNFGMGYPHRDFSVPPPMMQSLGRPHTATSSATPPLPAMVPLHDQICIDARGQALQEVAFLLPEDVDPVTASLAGPLLMHHLRELGRGAPRTPATPTSPMWSYPAMCEAFQQLVAQGRLSKTRVHEVDTARLAGLPFISTDWAAWVLAHPILRLQIFTLNLSTPALPPEGGCLGW